MPTIPPGRLNDVTNAADHITLVADNFEVLSEELFKVTPTFQNGAPNALIGPPNSGERVLGELWKDALGGWWKCTAAGTPGTWQQVLPAAVSADPSSGTIPVGCAVWNVESGAVKRHAGGYVWEVVIGGSASHKIGFWGVGSELLRNACLNVKSEAPLTGSVAPRLESLLNTRPCLDGAAGQRLPRLPGSPPFLVLTIPRISDGSRLPSRTARTTVLSASWMKYTM